MGSTEIIECEKCHYKISYDYGLGFADHPLFSNDSSSKMNYINRLIKKTSTQFDILHFFTCFRDAKVSDKSGRTDYFCKSCEYHTIRFYIKLESVNKNYEAPQYCSKCNKKMIKDNVPDYLLEKKYNKYCRKCKEVTDFLPSFNTMILWD